MDGWTVDRLPDKLREHIDGSFEESADDLMRMAADEIERLRARETSPAVDSEQPPSTG